MSKIGKIANKRKLKQKYLSREDLKTLDALRKGAADDRVIITCMGLYNHGKSSLLNALIKDLEGKTFKTADTRETTKNKVVQHKHYTFVDTPGLNAQEHDDLRVMDAVRESDINLFVHNVNTGEFVASEVAFFQKVQRYWKNPEQFIERTIFVLSRIDEVGDPEDIEAVATRMAQQLNEIFGELPETIPVSAHDYLAGLKDEEPELVEQSNFRALEESLETLYQQVREVAAADKKERYQRYCNDMIKKLVSLAEKKQLEASQLVRERDKKIQALEQDLERIEETLQNKYQLLREV